jgi:tetratricopeptide (TPR) repeat protein
MQAKYYYDKKIYAKSDSLCKLLIFQKPNEERYHLNLAICSYRMNMLNVTFKELSIILSKSKNIDSYFLMSKIFLQRHQPEVVLDILDAGLSEKNTSTVLLLKGTALLMSGRNSEALIIYDELRKYNSIYAKYLFELMYD